MFRILQVDPETAGLFINGSALLQHEQQDRMMKLVDDFFTHGSLPLLNWLSHLPPDNENADLYLLYSSLVHEIRHFVDLVFTPYGFHRLRTAFECYLTLPKILSNTNGSYIPVPLMSGADAINQKMLGLDGYDGSVIERYSKLITSRMQIISIDNSLHGGDSVLEALAFSQQVEIANTLFSDPVYQKKTPYLHGNASNGTFEFNMKYRWHYAIAPMLSKEPNQQTMRLIYWILYASLCGSIARDAKLSKYFPVTPESLKDIAKPGRYINERLPHSRIRALLSHFRAKSEKNEIDWTNSFHEVNLACKLLFGHTMLEEISADISSDEAYLQIHLDARKTYEYTQNDSMVDPIWPFEELIVRRKEFLNLFEQDPEQFISPVKFHQMMIPSRLPRVVFEFPCGSTKDEFSTQDWQVIYERRWRSFTDRSENETVYSYQRIYNHFSSPQSNESWNTLWALLAPAYKILLYGNRYFAIGEASLCDARHFFKNFDVNLRWDALYATPNNISSVSAYFDFFNLKDASCDICGTSVSTENAKYVSGWTMRSNDVFVQSFSSTHPTFAVDLLLMQDWSGWVCCTECLKTYAFI